MTTDKVTDHMTEMYEAAMALIGDLEPAALEAAEKAVTAIIGEHYGDYDQRVTEAAIRAYLSAARSAPEAGKVVREALANLIDDVQEWCDAVSRDTSWDSWDHCYKGLAYGNLDGYRAALASVPAPSRAEPVDGPEEIEIDRLRLAAFRTNSNEDKAAYYLAVSKWFQDRHYRRLASIGGKS